MDMSLEIQPDQYTIVVGPKFAAQVVRELSGDDDDTPLPIFEFKRIVDRGVSYLLENESFADASEKAKFEARYNNAYELDPVFVIRKVMTSLQTAGCYKDWLAELFTCNPPTKKSSISLQHLYALQARGALVVYVHCDDIITRATGLEPVLLQNEQQIERWANGECAGILQPHGVYSDPNSVQLDCHLYESDTHPLNSAVKKLKQFLNRRNTVLLGDDWDELSKDPLLGRFYKRFINDESTEGNSFVFHTVKASPDLRGLSLCGSSPFPTVYPITSSGTALWKQIDVVSMPFSHPCQYKLVCLLVSSQTGARDISHMMFNAPGVNFALVNTVTYEKTSIYCVSLRVSSESLHQLWSWLLTSSCESLLSSGLHGLAVHGGTFLWLKDPATINQGGDHHEVRTDLCESSLSENSSVANATSPHSSSNGTCTSKDTHSPGPYPTTTTSGPSSPSNQMSSSCGDSNSEVRHNKPIIQRYKVVRKRNQLIGGGGSSGGGGNHTDTGLYGGAYFMSKTCEETGMTFHAQHLSKYARRGSLPPIKCGETGNTLALFAERLQPPYDGAPNSTSSSSQTPSYVAIKRALLSDKFKNVQNPITRLVAPKMLLNLLQSKKQSFSPDERSSILAHRRNSDPGSYLQHRDKARRRQLFRDENMQWIKTHGPVIDKKIQDWKQNRLLRMQREYFYSQQREKLGFCHQQELQLMNSAKLVQPSSLYASLTSSSTAPTSLPSLTQAFVAAAGASVSGFSPSPFMYQLPSAGITPTPVLVPAPFISPYAFMGSYATIPATVATQPAATYIMPAGALAAAAQQRVMFLPTTSTTGNSTLMTTLASHTKPPFSSLLAPTTDTQPLEQKHTSDLVSNILTSRKRKHSFPEKLSSLLQPSSDSPADSNMSPPSEKRHHTITTTQTDNERHHSESPPPSHSHHTISSHSSHHHHRHRHHYTHHSSHLSHHSNTSSHYHHSSTPHHTHKPSSPLEQCLLQIPSLVTDDRDSSSLLRGSPAPLPSIADYSSHPTPQLWQFLLELLLTTDCSHLIEWTNTKEDDEYEFIIHDPVKVAQLWGKYTNNSNMNYDKLARGLCHYYSKGIIEKVDGKKLTFRYNGLARSYVQKRCSQTVDVANSLEEMVVVE